LRRGLIVSVAAALLTPAAFGGMLAGAMVLADANDSNAFAQGSDNSPPLPTVQASHPTAGSLGRATAVAFIGGHIGR
jgi:hypothetical protein